MLSKLRRIRGPSPATVIACVALVFATGGYAVAGPKGNKDEVKLTTATGGPVETTTPGDPVPIPLANAAFTQRAGEAVLVIVRGHFATSEATHHCGVSVHVTEEIDGGVGIFNVEDHSDKGGQATGAALLPAPATDTAHVLEAVAVESEGSPSEGLQPCDGEDLTLEPPDTGNDTWTVSATVTVVVLRN